MTMSVVLMQTNEGVGEVDWGGGWTGWGGGGMEPPQTSVIPVRSSSDPAGPGPNGPHRRAAWPPGRLKANPGGQTLTLLS